MRNDQGPRSIHELPLRDDIKKSIESGNVYSNSQVFSFTESDEKRQSLDFIIAGLHPKSCQFALKKLSLYEKYKDFLSIIKESDYDESTKQISFVFSHGLLPVSMGLIFNLPRIRKEGIFSFYFDRGFLAGLKGQIHVINNQGKCLFYTRARWEGPHTGYSDTLFSFFSGAFTKLAMENLIRISSNY